jgi:2-dehydropantoate 2-reductase
MAPGPVLVMGAGAIGGWVGGSLAAAGVPVRWVGRPRVLEALRDGGLTLTDLSGGRRSARVAASDLLEAPQGPAALALLCTKSAATASAARQLAAALPAGTPVLSLQNGVDNVATARQAAPGLHWIAGMVPFNVAQLDAARGGMHWHRGTEGRLAAANDPALAPWIDTFAAAGVPLSLHADMRSVQWGKLLLNLNNPVNALSRLPLKAELMDRGFRHVFAALQVEALAALRAAGIRPARMTPLPPGWLPHLLRLPNALFERLAARMLRIDDKARSSMADDLAASRPTEIDALSGAVVRLARAHGLAAPLNERMVQWLSMPEVPHFGGLALRRALGL